MRKLIFMGFIVAGLGCWPAFDARRWLEPQAIHDVSWRSCRSGLLAVPYQKDQPGGRQCLGTTAPPWALAPPRRTSWTTIGVMGPSAVHEAAIARQQRVRRDRWDGGLITRPSEAVPSRHPSRYRWMLRHHRPPAADCLPGQRFSGDWGPIPVSTISAFRSKLELANQLHS